MFKTVSLPSDRWEQIAGIVEASAHPDALKLVGMLKEQVSGSVKVKVSGRNVTVSAGRGGNLRDAKVLP